MEGLVCLHATCEDKRATSLPVPEGDLILLMSGVRFGGTLGYMTEITELMMSACSLCEETDWSPVVDVESVDRGCCTVEE